MVIRRSFKKQGVCTLRSVQVGLSRAGTGQSSLDHDMQRDRSRTLGGLRGRARGVKEHGYRLGQRVGVGMLMVEVVRVYVLTGWRRRYVCWQGRGWGRGRQLKVDREIAVVLERERRGDDGVVRGRRLLRVAFGDRGGPLWRHRWGGLSGDKAGTSRGLDEVSCKRTQLTESHH